MESNVALWVCFIKDLYGKNDGFGSGEVTTNTIRSSYQLHDKGFHLEDF